MDELRTAERRAMRRALDLAATPGLPLGPNPRVGCVVLSSSGEQLGEGFHRGAGTPHAEVVALSRCRPGAEPAVAVVTLEPCRHVGRTAACTDALRAAGVRRVVIGHPDPTPSAGGGAQLLRAAGIQVVEAMPTDIADRAAALVAPWLFGLAHQRPWVTWKVATTLDGRAAARDGSSRWITGPAARRDVHAVRAAHDVVLVGTGTALVDDPELTVRDGCGRALPHQPARAVMGLRDLPAHARAVAGPGRLIRLRTRDVDAALGDLFALGLRRVLLEGGPQLAAAFLGAGVVDEIVAYVAPALLGAGPAALADLGVVSIDDALRPRLVDVAVITDPPPDPSTAGTGPAADIRLTLRLDPPGA
ncbi:bifunctional diaminohydroxyphosphoribosylaminopyrimidine deaminase/5-amino-6-(5-phosphoribosylamino)uracil reductase RibD [Pseudactinotalea terrae]|uniref:bifunctional diaminohydroxyphosphoribosylaminopyrimidine deaminase/5-amino-6-(5-phosphoribosylamino)uracil reductase RibD n=1 Tax=Pseudactinotalea terrae TaxID=1743262 RepID=UPI0019D525C1|nr:bifunctional diaminohydroxyphosphoribosylaminopyrimidine deaminase/5-amino-6-(5-phosphoribosylamino)uracil reductase RibD [Pseudactinotalea terrae]